jgi:hypothetical protein
VNAQIKELTEQLPIATDVQKSIANRLESALTKSGSAQSRLRMASQSLNALAKKLSDDEQGYADIFARIFEIGALIGVDNKKPTEPKATREIWFDADSPQAQAILANATAKPKPRKKATKTEPKYYKDEQLTEMLREAFSSMLAGK